MLFLVAFLKRSKSVAPACITTTLVVLCGLLMGPVAGDAVSKSEEGFNAWPMWGRVTLCIVTVLLSAMFCGLTIGLLGIDTVTLEIIASAGAEPERTYAQKILPIRQLGHQLLATLLVGNMLTLVLTSQLVAAIVQSTELVNFIVGTLVVLIFGEIIPMAYCNKGSNGLQVGVKSLSVLKASLFILYPVAKPLGMLLDCIVSHDAGQLYDKNELRELIRVHYEKYADKSGIDQDELRMMLSALEMNEVTVDAAMTPLDRTLMLDGSLSLDAALQRRLWEYGKSRIPVYAGTRSNIIGVLYVKDLINVSTLRGDDVVTIREFLIDHPRQLLVVKEKAQLQDALKIFESHYTQLLFVERVGEYSSSCAAGASLKASSVGEVDDPLSPPPHGKWGSAPNLTSNSTGAERTRSGAASLEPPATAGSTAMTAPASRHYRNDQSGMQDSAAQRRVSFHEGAPSEKLEGLHKPPRGSLPHTPSSHSVEKHHVSDPRREWLATPDTISPRSLLDPESKNHRAFVGIVTLEDIIERLIASEILDEDEYNMGSDGDGNDTNSDVENELLLRSVKGSHSLQKQPVKAPRVNFYSYGLATGAREKGDDDLSEEQRWALASYLARAYVFFALWSTPKIKFLLDEVGDKRVYIATDSTSAYEQHPRKWNGEPLDVQANGVIASTEKAGAAAGLAKETGGTAATAEATPVLYIAGQPSHTFTLLLSGGMDVSIGGGQFRTELRSFASLGDEVLTSANAFVPDYTAVVSRPSRLISISHEDIYRVERKINAIRRQRGRRPVKLTTFDVAAVPPPALRDDDGDVEPPTRVDVVAVDSARAIPKETASHTGLGYGLPTQKNLSVEDRRADMA